MDLLGREFRLSFVGAETVLLLLNIIKLSIAISENIGIIEKHVGKTLKASHKFFLCLRSLTVAPTVVVSAPNESAVLTYEERKRRVVSLTLLKERRGGVSEGFAVSEVLCKFLDYLLVIVYVVNIGLYVIVSARIDTGTGRVNRLCHRVNGREERIVLLITHVVIRAVALKAFGLVLRTPADDGGVVEIALKLLEPLGKNAVYRLGTGVVESPVCVFAPKEISLAVSVVEKSFLKDLLVRTRR